VSRGPGIEVPDRLVTMWKVLPVLAFIVFACDISRDVLVHGDPARKPEIVGRSGGGGDYEHQVSTHKKLRSCFDEFATKV